MNERFRFGVGHVWILINGFCLLLPIFMPSSADPQHFFENVMLTATVTMFLLSFPMSLFGIPVIYVASEVLGADLRSMEGMYLSLSLMFVFGVIQWFWIVPRILVNYPKFQIPDLYGAGPVVLLAEANIENRTDFYDTRGRTPVERLINNEPEAPVQENFGIKT